MANLFIGYNRGADLSPDQATVGAATGGTDVELRIDDTKGVTREEAKLIADAIVRYLEDGRTATVLL